MKSQLFSNFLLFPFVPIESVWWLHLCLLLYQLAIVYDLLCEEINYIFHITPFWKDLLLYCSRCFRHSDRYERENYQWCGWILPRQQNGHRRCERRYIAPYQTIHNCHAETLADAYGSLWVWWKEYALSLHFLSYPYQILRNSHWMR